MQYLLWLLLPIAAATGWLSAIRYKNKSITSKNIKFSFRNEYIKGLNYILDEKPDKALDCFMSLLNTDSESIETHLLLSALFRRRGEMDRAIRIHQNLIARPHLNGQQRSLALMELGKDYLQAGLLDRAEDLYKELRVTGYMTSEANQQLQIIYEQEQDWGKAIECANSITYSPSRANNRIRRAISHYWCELAEREIKNNRIKNAYDYVRLGLKADNENLRALLLFGDVLIQGRRVRAAKRQYMKALSMYPYFLPLIVPRLRKLTIEANDENYFIKVINQLGNQIYNYEETVIYLAGIFVEQGKQDKALEILEKSLNNMEESIPILREYLKILQVSGNQLDLHHLNLVIGVLEKIASKSIGYLCNECGFKSKNLFWQCPGCHNWGTMQPKHESMC